MITVTFFGQFGVAEIALTLGALAYVTHLVLDTLGISRTSKTLRVENEDLVRRNKELEEIVRRFGDKSAAQDGEIAVLVERVGELSARDQAAVLTLLSEHENAAGIRHERMLGVLTEIRDVLRVRNGVAQAT